MHIVLPGENKCVWDQVTSRALFYKVETESQVKMYLKARNRLQLRVLGSQCEKLLTPFNLFLAIESPPE